MRPLRLILGFVLLLPVLLMALVPAGAQSSEGPSTRWFATGALNQGLSDAPGFVDRDTPRGLMETFSVAAESEDWQTAAHALDLSGIAPELQAKMGPVLAENLYEVMQRGMWMDWSSLPDRPDGLDATASSDDPMAGEPRRNFRLAILDLPERPVEIRISRVKPENGAPAWVFSEASVANIPALHEVYGPSAFERSLPSFLQQHAFWTLAWWEVIAIPLVVLLALGAAYLSYSMVRRIKRRQPYRIVRTALDAVQTPIALMAFVGTFSLIKTFVFTFSGPISRILAPLQSLLFVVALALIAVRVVDAVLDRLVRDNIEELTEEHQKDTRDLYTNISAARRVAIMLAFVVGAALVLIQTKIASTLGFSLLASAGVLGLIFAFAARTVLSDIMASLQIAIAKTARIGDAVLWHGDWCTVEKINFTYLQLRSWDNRRLMVPVAQFVSETFENWTKQDPQLTKIVALRLDHRADIETLREAFQRFVEADEDITDKESAKVQVTGHSAEGMEVWFMADGPDPSTGWAIACRLREAMLKEAARLEAEAGKEPDRPAYLPREREMLIGEFDRAG